MSENIPESIPTSSDHRSSRPTKRRALTPSSTQSASVEALFANPDRPVNIPSSGTSKPTLAPPEIVANVQGSSAGAGSGEFHVYKASRRREYERLRVMDEETEREERDKAWEENREERRREEEGKLERNRRKREKAKMRKGKGGKGSGGKEDAEDEVEVGVKKRLGPAKVAVREQDGVVDGKDGEDESAEPAVEEHGITIHEDD